ncbi:MAG: hypothetical protein RRB13_11750 [bacterium]|nr:hypothetical protein [bacterium]
MELRGKGKFWLGTLASGIFMWVLAGLWHEVILAEFYRTEKHADHEGTALIFVAYLLLAGLMSLLYGRWRRSGSWLEGLAFGVLAGLLWVFPHELAMAGAHGESIGYVFKNAVWYSAEQGFGGLVLAWVFRGKFKSG